ncbi:putative RNA-directed DNA polymerase from transposon BS [Trichonephila clavipes]|nr:putative RNA-directed DNA polymerase from transposon BS [Trichonephila clavipes]
MNPQRRLLMVTWNAYGVRTRICELQDFLNKYKPDIMALQETWLRPSPTLALANYKVYRYDRIYTTYNPCITSHVGTAILIKISLKRTHIPTPDLKGAEATIVALTPERGDTALIISIYIPPSNSHHTLPQTIDTLMNQGFSSIIIMGDFNAKHSSWGCDVDSPRGVRLKTHIERLGYRILAPPTPTRYGYNSASTLDSAITQNADWPCIVTSRSELSSDHNLVTFDFLTSTHFFPLPHKRYTNKNKLGEIHAKHNCSRQFHTTRSTHTRRHRHAARSKEAKLNYIKVELAIQEKTPIFNEEKIANFNKDKAMLEQELQSALGEIALISGPIDNCKIHYPRGNNANDVNTKPKPDLNLKNLNTKNSNDRINQVKISGSEEFKLPKKAARTIKEIPIQQVIKVKKAAGIDRISNRMLKHLPLISIFVLTYIITNIIKLGYFPLKWKTAAVIPILRPGKDPTKAGSFRPIALLSVAEKIILTRMCHHVDSTNLIIPEQHGFRPNLSTSHQLLRVVQTVRSEFEKQKSTANRRAPMTVRTPVGSDPDLSDGTPSGNRSNSINATSIQRVPSRNARNEPGSLNFTPT